MARIETIDKRVGRESARLPAAGRRLGGTRAWCAIESQNFFQGAGLAPAMLVKSFLRQGAKLCRVASQRLTPGFLILKRLEYLGSDGILFVLREVSNSLECVLK